MASERQVAAQLLEQVLAGELPPEEGEARWPANEGDDHSLNAAFHALGHYRADARTRAKNERYSEMQTAELREIAKRLANDEDLDQSVLDSLEPRGCLLQPLGSRRRRPG